MRSSRGLTIQTCVLLSAVLLFDAAFAQTRYRDIIFPSATSTLDIPFGSNLGVNGSTDTLILDFYEPTGDTLTERPLVVLMHGGSLISGGRTNMASLCTDLARRGYVAATIEYRLGIEVPKGETTIQEAMLRGVQDTKAAVRYFRANAALYGVDTTQVFLAGSSAGSMLALHCAYWDQDEIPPAVDQTKWGDIEGSSGNPGHSSDVNAVVSFSGAVLDPSWIDPGEPPSGNMHGLLDEVVPPYGGVSTDFGIPLFGGPAVSRAATENGIYNHSAFFPNGGHGANPDSLPSFTANFFYSVMMVTGASPGDFTSMDLTTNSLSLFLYDDFIFTTTAVDVNGNRITVPQSMVTYTCDASVGTMASTGIFTPGAAADSGYVYATFNGVTDSCFVKTYDFAYFVLSPDLVVTNTTQTVPLSIDVYDADSVKHELSITSFTFSSTNPSVGTVDSLGIFTPLTNGTTQIVAWFNGYSDTTTIRVETANGTVVFDGLENVSGWTFAGLNLDSVTVSVDTDHNSEGSGSFRIDYAYTYNSGTSPYVVYLSKDLLVYGLPDSIYLDVKSDGQRHRLYYRFTDTNGEFFRGSGKKYLNDSTKFDLINAPMTGLSPEAGTPVQAYPLTLKRMEIQLAGVSTQGFSNIGTIYVDNLRLVYPPVPTGVEATERTPGDFRLEQNYPNPFNPSTTIRYMLSSSARVRLSVYDMLGRKLVDLVDEDLPAGVHEAGFDASVLPSGVYLYRLQAGDVSRSRKLLLVK